MVQKFKGLKKWKKNLIVGIVVVLILFGILNIVLFANRNSAMGSATISVQSSEVINGDLSTTIDTSGSIANAGTTSIDLPEGLVIEEVLCASGDAVEEGQSLATVTKASVALARLEVNEKIELVEDAIDDLSSKASDETTDEYLKKVVLENTLKELEALSKELEKIQSTNTIVASESGIISEVNVSTSQSNTNDGNNTTNMSTTQDYNITLLTTGEDQTTTLTDIVEGDLSTLTITTPVKGAKPQDSVASTEKYTATITWDCAGTFEAGASYTATINLIANPGYAFTKADNYGITIKDAVLVDQTPQIKNGENQEGNTLQIKAKFQVAADQVATTPQDNTQTQGGSTTTDMTTAKSGTSGSSSASSTSSNNQSSGFDVSAYEVTTKNLFTLATGSKLTVSVSVDELDINSVEMGQSANVSLDALEGQVFPGEITNVASASSNSGSGSNAKYLVEITIDKVEGMKVGMSASAVININESKDTLIIPINALQERGNQTFVYTTQDEDGNLGGEVEVTTGLSDGTQVEILTGLEEGDMVYYTRILSDGEDTSFAMPSMGGAQGMGSITVEDMPSGGERPTGSRGGAPSESRQ